MRSTIEELALQLNKEHEECGRMTSKLKKFIKAHNLYLRSQEDLKSATSLPAIRCFLPNNWNDHLIVWHLPYFRWASMLFFFNLACGLVEHTLWLLSLTFSCTTVEVEFTKSQGIEMLSLGFLKNGAILMSELQFGGTRWNPTHEQVGILEKLYRGSGMRTPNAQQIDQITAQLNKFGKIEGKNVFYWFQNHKARQRQKQKRSFLSQTFEVALATKEAQD